MATSRQLKRPKNFDLISFTAIVVVLSVYAIYRLVFSFAAVSDADFNGDGRVNIFDLSILANNYGQGSANHSKGDANGDGAVTILDLAIVALNWGKSINATVGQTFDVPTSIDSTGTTEVSTQLMQWLSQVPAGTADAPNTIRFAVGGTYWCDYSILLQKDGTGGIDGAMWRDGANPSNPINIPAFSLDHMRVDFNGATIVQRSTTPYELPGNVIDPRKRWGVPILSTGGATDIEIFNGTIEGSHPTGGYDARYEEWTGIRLIGTNNASVNHLVVRNMNIKNVWGDFIYIVSSTSNGELINDVQIHNNNLNKAGRQGIVLNGGVGVSIRDNVFRNVSRFTFDSEPAAGQGFSNVVIERNTGGVGNLGYFQFSGPNRATADNLTIRDNTIDNRHFLVRVTGRSDIVTYPRRSGFTFTNNHSTDSADPIANDLIVVGNWDNVLIRGNIDYLKLNNSGVPVRRGVTLNGTTNAVVEQNCWYGAIDNQC